LPLEIAVIGRGFGGAHGHVCKWLHRGALRGRDPFIDVSKMKRPTNFALGEALGELEFME
jgi:hypothetical protein